MIIELSYRGHYGCPSKCGLSILRVAGRVWVIFTELPDNPGSSISRRIEHLASVVYRRFLYNEDPEAIRWAERYPALGEFKAIMEEVTFTWNGKEFINPEWRRIRHVSRID